MLKYFYQSLMKFPFDSIDFILTFLFSHTKSIHSDELRTNIRVEVGESKNKLEETSKLTESALKRANEVYDEALTLFANVNSLTAPEINIEELKKSAAAANKEVSSQLSCSFAISSLLRHYRQNVFKVKSLNWLAGMIFF